MEFLQHFPSPAQSPQDFLYLYLHSLTQTVRLSNPTKVVIGLISPSKKEVCVAYSTNQLQHGQVPGDVLQIKEQILTSLYILFFCLPFPHHHQNQLGNYGHLPKAWFCTRSVPV